MLQHCKEGPVCAFTNVPECDRLRDDVKLEDLGGMMIDRIIDGIPSLAVKQEVEIAQLLSYTDGVHA